MTSKNLKLNKYRRPYDININDHPRPSWVNATIIDRKNGRTCTADFHLYRRDRSMFAEVALPEQDKWVGEDLDAISPLVCAAAMDYFDVVLFEV
jgi:hypothetical protein